jgi:predicted ATPase
MPINRIAIKNYKSLKCLELDLKPLMVFVGPNNSGKSNIFDCLWFLSEFVKSEPGNAIVKRGEFNHVVFDGIIEQRISIQLEGSTNVKDKERFYWYSLELSGDKYGHCFIEHEIFRLIKEDGKQDLLKYPDEKGSATVFDETGKPISSYGVGRDRSYLYYFRDSDRYPILGHFSNEVQSWVFFNLLPPSMRAPLPVRRELQLQTHGENLSGVLHVIQSEYPDRFKEIEDILKSAVPELKELSTGLTAHETGQTYVRISEKNLSTSIPAWGMSDGTLRFLACLAALYSPASPKLICFEEPENYVHPRLLELMVNLLKGASEKTQVLINTHSPYLVDFLDPGDLFIVEKVNGETQVKSAEDKKGIKEALKTLGLGEMWYSGGLGGVP